MHSLAVLGSKKTPSVPVPLHPPLDSTPPSNANKPHDQSGRQHVSDTNEKTGEALTDLTGKIVKCSSHAVAFGAFSDIWQGRYEGALVAIKVPRLHASDVTAIKLVKVSIVYSDLLSPCWCGNVCSDHIFALNNVRAAYLLVRRDWCGILYSNLIPEVTKGIRYMGTNTSQECSSFLRVFHGSRYNPRSMLHISVDGAWHDA
jgi:hypothetical protein